MYPQQHYTRPYFYHPVPFYGFYDPFAAFNYYNNNYLYLANQNQLNGFHPYQNFVNNNEITTKPRTRGRPRKNDEKIVELVGWKEKKICCGKIFIGPQHQILLHPLFIRPHRGKCAYKIISDIPKKTELRIEASKENKADDGLSASISAKPGSGGGDKSKETAQKLSIKATKHKSPEKSKRLLRSSTIRKRQQTEEREKRRIKTVNVRK